MMQFRTGHTLRLGRSAILSGLWKIALALALVILILTCAVPVYARSYPHIGKVDVKEFADVVQITVSSSSPVAIHDGRLGDRYLIFDMYGSLALRERKRVHVGDGGLRTIRCGWYRSSPPIARIVVGTTSAREYSVRTGDGKCTRVIKVWKEGATARPGKGELAGPSARPIPGGAVQTDDRAAAKPVITPMPKAMVLGSSEVLAAPKVEMKAPAVRLVSLDFVASDIHDVLKALAIQGGVNIVASPDVKGNVTVSLNRVTVEEALKLITNVSGFRFQQIEGSYVVGTADNMKAVTAGSSGPQESVTQVATIVYADAPTLAKMLQAQFPGIDVTSSAGAQKDVKGPVVLVLAGPKGAVEGAKALAETIEASFAQTAAESVFETCEVKYADITEAAALLTASLPKLKVSVGPMQGFNLKCPTAVAMGADQTGGGTTGMATGAQTSTGTGSDKAPSKTLILQGPESEVQRAKAFLAKIDLPQPQIMIEARVVDISDTGSEDLGIQWGDKGILDQPTFTETRSSGTDALTIGRMDRTPLQIQATLKALVQSGKGKVLASPNVLAIDGKPASAFIGDEVKYVIRVEQTQTGTNVMTETARVGVQLHTISRINSDGYITMNLHPEVSVITKWIDTPAGLSLPEIARRFVESTVRVKDGETIVIGGLIRDEDIKSMSGVPFLKDLPIIGEFFKSRSTTKSHSEIMMFITPRVLSSV
jgi:general secretion pathway protein D